jgi:hypothetical protein
MLWEVGTSEELPALGTAGWILFPPISQSALHRFATLARLDDERLRYIQTRWCTHRYLKRNSHRWNVTPVYEAWENSSDATGQQLSCSFSLRWFDRRVKRISRWWFGTHAAVSYPWNRPGAFLHVRAS